MSPLVLCGRNTLGTLPAVAGCGGRYGGLPGDGHMNCRLLLLWLLQELGETEVEERDCKGKAQLPASCST